MQILKRHGGWKSNATAEGYIDQSISNKIRTSNKIFEQASSYKVTLNITTETTGAPSHTIVTAEQINETAPSDTIVTVRFYVLYVIK